MSENSVLVKVDADGIATVILNRPELHNAIDERLIALLGARLAKLDADPAVRVVVLAGSGRSFCAGADLNWMKRMAKYSAKDNLRDARGLTAMLNVLSNLSKPTVARVHGPAYGGGAGIVACCDIAIASREAAFAFSEVRLGLIPAAISPYVVDAVGQRAARRYFLTGERFDAAEAFRIGLVHDIVEEGALNERIGHVLFDLFKGGPHALAAAKDLVRAVARAPLDDAMLDDTARRIAAIRSSAEGREGVSAFLEKRDPKWTRHPGTKAARGSRRGKK
jgi:methylglutaconyl-CoA hydratase